VDQKQRTVQVNVGISPDLIDKLLKMTETRPKAAAKNR